MKKYALFLSVVLVACSEGNSGSLDLGLRADTGTSGDMSTATDMGALTDTGTPTDMGTLTDMGALTDTGTPTDLGTPTDMETPTDMGGAIDITGLVINEIRASGDDWIELYNTSSSSIDLGGLQITDSDAPETPALDHTTIFPTGLVLEAGAYFVVVADLGSATRDGLQTDCLEGALPTCVEASYGISRGDGDTIFILAPDNSVLLSAVYPPAAAGDEETWARLPNGSGDFAIGTPTPGAANAAVP